MSIGALTSLGGTYLQSLLGTSNSKSGTSGTTTTSSSATPQDSPGLSPFAQLMTELQQLQQSDPTQYQQLTQQIASKLQTLASTAQSNGNTAGANTLNQLATDFTSASQSGQLPNMQDIATAMQGHHHGHHHHASAYGTGPTQADSFDPASIITSTQYDNSTPSTSL